MPEADLTSVPVTYPVTTAPAVRGLAGTQRADTGPRRSPLSRGCCSTRPRWPPPGTGRSRFGWRSTLCLPACASNAGELIAVAPALSSILLLWLLVFALPREHMEVYAAVYGRDQSRGDRRPRLVLDAAESSFIAGALIVVVTYFSRQAGADLSSAHSRLLFVPLSLHGDDGGSLRRLLDDFGGRTPFRDSRARCGSGMGAARSRL